MLSALAVSCSPGKDSTATDAPDGKGSAATTAAPTKTPTDGTTGALQTAGAKTSGATATAADPSMLALPSGVRYSVLQEGSGASPAMGATVRLHCRGWFLTSTGAERTFVDTRKGGAPRRYLVSSDTIGSQGQAFKIDAPLPLISGLTEIVSGMKTGERRKVFVPASLGYGSVGLQSTVPRNQDLFFDVELVGVGP